MMTLFFFFSYKMVIADSDYNGPLFKVSQVFLWDDDLKFSSSAERWKLDEADVNHGSDPVPGNCFFLGVFSADLIDLVTPEDLELTKQLNDLGLPLSFQTNKEKNGPVKCKKKGKLSKHPDTCHNPVDETLYEVTGEEIVSPAKFHDKTSSPLSCISMLGQSESSYREVAMDIDMTQCAYGEGDKSACCTGFASGVCREINNDNLNQVATNDAQDDDFLISNDCVDLKTAPASDTGVSAGSHLKGAGVNYCGTEYDESLIDSECLEVSPIVGKNTDCDTIYSDDGAATCHPHAIESELLPKELNVTEMMFQIIMLNMEIGWSHGILSMREHTSTIYEHTLLHGVHPQGWSIWQLAGVLNQLIASEECGTQNSTKPPEETLIEENLEVQQHEEYLTKSGVAVGNLISDITTHGEDQSLNHSDECLVRSSCNDGVSCCSVSNILDHIITSNEGCIQVASEVNHTPLENMVIDMFGLDTKSDPFESKQGKKVKRRQRQRKLYNEAEDLHFQEMPEVYSVAVGKYWCQRHSLFSRFDDGVKMDEEGWFSVTPEVLARHRAIRCASGVIIDGFTGADTVFLSPPWGGPDYVKATTFDLKTMLRPHDGYTLFNVAKEIASGVMFLPRNINFNQLAELSLSSCPSWSLEVEKVYLNNKLKAITAYFSDTAVGNVRS
ncbi:Trimethylguanosine synthase [Glycine soja]